MIFIGAGSWVSKDFDSVKCSYGFSSFDTLTNSSTQEVFKRRSIAPELDIRDKVRECCETSEHPNTLPIILGLDVTGSMNHASKACVDAINDVIMKLYEKYPDVEIAVAGIGDFSWDEAPLQLSQFESDVRIADNLFNIYIENGGGGNSWESYSALWYAGLYHTRLDCWKRGQKGIIITMGDEMLNPSLPRGAILRTFGDHVQADVDTDTLYKEASEKYDIYHLAITNNSSYNRYKNDIKTSFGSLLGQNLRCISTDALVETICQIVEDSRGSVGATETVAQVTNEGIAW